jgi:hypothetical protein
VEAGGGVFGGDAAEGEDRSGGGGEAGFAEALEALAGKRRLAGERLFEDRGEEDGVRVGLPGVVDFFEGVAGESEEGRGKVGFGEEGADLGGGELAGGGGEVDAMGSGGEGDVGPGVEQETGGAAG